MENAYSSFNSVDSQIEPNQAVVLGYQKDNEILRSKEDKARSDILQQKLSLSSVNSEISVLESKLIDAKNRKSNIELSISTLESNLVSYHNQIEANNLKIRDLEKIIDDLETRSDSLKSVYTLLEITVERIRSDLARGQSKEDVLIVDIQVLQDKVVIEEKKLATRELQKLESMISILLKSQPSVQNQIDDANYQCYQIAAKLQN